ncbi:MAG TPA: GyrI-like domain-containing protein [Mucilaginibacter sp.]|nr:GyrI-like domain-containing protein [Mucilaginibacter sp.]
MTPNIPFELKNCPGFFVAGIAIRTTNQDERSDADIGRLWTKFTSEGIAGQIENKLSEDIYCVYTDYESDYTGWYTAVLGCRVAEPFHSPDWFMALVPSGSYRVYRPCGEFPACVGNTWRQIWKDGSMRSYIADYDLYKAGAKSFNETETAVYLGVM